MQISFEAIKKATNGVIDTFIEKGRLNFRRFTDKQLKYFADTLNSMNKPSKATATSSVIIDFYTDATELNGSFYCTRATTRAQCFLDVYVNGQMITHAGEMLKPEKTDFNLTFIQKSASPFSVQKEDETLFGKERFTFCKARRRSHSGGGAWPPYRCGRCKAP